MATPSDILKLKIQTRGDENWDTATDDNMTRIEESIASEGVINTTGGTTALTSTDYLANNLRRPIIRVTGTLASNATITASVPSSAKTYLVLNQTSGSYTVSFQFGSQTAIAIPQGHALWVEGDTAGSRAVGLPINLSTGAAYSSDGVSRTDIATRGQLDDRTVILQDKDASSPPGSPTTGHMYYVASSASGAWSGQSGKIARYTGSGWVFSDMPTEGMLAWLVDEGKHYVSDGGSLVSVVGSGGLADGDVTEAKLASSSVTVNKIGTGAVTEAKIGTGAVALAKLKSDVYASESEAKAGSSTTKIPAVANVKHAAFPTGTAMVFRQTSAPTGWTKVTASGNNSALRVVTGTASTGGTVDFSTAFTAKTLSGSVGNTVLTEAQMPVHRHFVLADVQADQAASAVGTGNQVPRSSNEGNNFSYRFDHGTSTEAGVGRSASAGGGQAHTHSLSMSSLDLAVKFVDVIVATKD